MNTKQYELRTPDVTIRVNPERADLVEARVIDGVRCLVIRAEEGVELNGLNVHWPDEQPAEPSPVAAGKEEKES